ncbi:MAG TPA: hypothetical protein VEJ18_21760, partial [Planctomycetota bacterium]|nr:hypothetical protein [Planctomycetota bacterium]
MTPPAPPGRRAGPWPLLAIGFLVLLLTAFLVLRLRNREREAAVVLKPPPPPPAVVEPPVAPVPPVPPPPDPAPPKAVADPLPALLEKAVKALDEKRWKDAEALLAEAAAVAKADDPSIAAARARLATGRKAEEDARLAAEKAKAEAKARRDQDFADARERAEKARQENRWDAALAEYAKVLAAHPELATDADFVDTRDRLKRFRDESDSYYEKAFTEAKTLFADGRYAAALSAAERALG